MPKNIWCSMHLGKHIWVFWKDFCFLSIRRLYFIYVLRFIWKSVTRTFWGAFFWAPIPFKRYQNTSGCGTDVTSFFTRRARLEFFANGFPLTYDLNGFKCRVKRHLLSLIAFPCFWFFFFCFVTLCLLVAVQPYMEYAYISIPKKEKKSKNSK